MSLTYRQFKDLVARYAGQSGKSAQSLEVDIFARQVMQLLLYAGSSAAIRKVSIVAENGCFSLPPEVETIIKARVDGRSSEIWSKYYTMHSGASEDGCFDAATILKEEGIQTPLAYDLPHGGAIVGVMSSCDEDPESFVTVQGLDQTGKEVYTTHRGDKVVGEKYTINKNTIHYGKVHFGTITHVVKPVTNGYVQLVAVDPSTKQIIKYLADWAPSETIPRYRKFKLISPNKHRVSQVTMICRVRIKDNYGEEEVVLFDNEFAIILAAQRINAEVNNLGDVANYKRQAVEDIQEQEASYKRPTTMRVDVFKPMSGGSIRNII